MNRYFSLVIIFFALATGLFAQTGGGGPNSTCETASPFCTGTVYNFPAGVNAGSGQPGPCYSCLATTPNPAWYYMKVLTSGNIIIKMHSVPSKDIDFCCWGPFPNQNACTQLTCNKKVSCSYSASTTETCNIPNGIAGEYYILVITNFSNAPCNIIFEQTGGTGTTDCTILPPACSNNSPICTGQTLQFTAQAVSNAIYNWWGPANFSSTLQNPTILNATPANAGDYFLRITVNGQPSQDTSVTTAYIYQPVANAGNDTSISNGVTAALVGSATGGSGSYQYHWEPAAKLVDPNMRKPQTVNLFATTMFTVQVTDDSASCPSSDVVTVNIVGGALAVNSVATPAYICAGASSQLQAFGSGGAGNYTYSWSGPNGFTSTLQNPTVIPYITSNYQVTVHDGYNTSISNVVVTVIPLPVANAGTNLSIPNGTYTYLDGSVVNGNSNYFYSWSPADKLVNANIKSPQTTNLQTTTVFSLMVTDLISNCVSDNSPTVSVEVTGVPLNVNPVAIPSRICRGDTARIHASAGGGNVGYYQYIWSSEPPGFTSTDPDPMVDPSVNTSYLVSVFDGFNTTTGNTAVEIYPEPSIRLGPPDTTVCVYDTIRLNAGNPGASYLWSNGATTREIRIGTTGIGYDSQTFSVEVTNEHGCKSSAGINVIFSFDACTGIGENNIPGTIRLYPNPSGGMVTLEMEGISGGTNGTIVSPYGKEVKVFSVPASASGKVTRTLDLTGLPKGIYLVKFNNPDFYHSQKLLIE